MERYMLRKKIDEKIKEIEKQDTTNNKYLTYNIVKTHFQDHPNYDNFISEYIDTLIKLL